MTTGEFMVQVSNCSIPLKGEPPVRALPSVQELHFIYPHLHDQTRRWTAALQLLSYTISDSPDPIVARKMSKMIQSVMQCITNESLNSKELCKILSNEDDEPICVVFIPLLYHFWHSEQVRGNDPEPWIHLFSTLNENGELKYYPSLLLHACLPSIRDHSDNANSVPLSNALALCPHLSSPTGLVVAFATHHTLLQCSVDDFQAKLQSLWGVCTTAVKDTGNPIHTVELAFCHLIGCIQAVLYHCYNETTPETAKAVWNAHRCYIEEFYGLWKNFTHQRKNNALNLQSAPLLLAARVFSAGGLDFWNAQRNLQLLQGDIRRDVLWTQLVGVKTDNKPLKVLSKYGNASEERMGMLANTIHFIQVYHGHLTDKPVEQLPECHAETREFAEALVEWIVEVEKKNVHVGWTKETALTFAAIVLYFFLAERADSYAKQVIRGEKNISIKACDIQGEGGNCETGATRLLRACLAFASSLVQLKRTKKTVVDFQRAVTETASTTTSFKRMAEDFLFPHCPNCGLTFVAYDACAAVKCSKCPWQFCALCFHGVNGDVHGHVLHCILNPNRGSYFVSDGQFQDNFARNVYCTKLAALLKGETTVNVAARSVDIAKEGQKGHTQLDMRAIASDRNLFQYTALHHLTMSDFFKDQTKAKFADPNTLAPPQITDLAKPIPLTHYGTCFEELNNALFSFRKVRDVNEAFGKVKNYSSLLMYLFGLITESTTDLRSRLTADLSTSHYFNVQVLSRKPGHVYDAVSTKGSDDATPSTSMANIQWTDHYSNDVRNNQPIMFLFEGFPQVEKEADVLREMCDEHKFVSALEKYRKSFTEEAAANTEVVLRFCYDARRVVREKRWSAREIRRLKLSHLISPSSPTHRTVITTGRVREFITAAKKMLEYLSKADNNCNGDLALYTMNTTDKEDEIDLEECLFTTEKGKGDLIHVLYTGANAEQTVVGYGNANHGQNVVLEGWEPRGEENALLLEQSELVRYDAKWTETLATLRTPIKLHAFAEDWTSGDRNRFLLKQVIARAMYYHPGIAGCPPLGRIDVFEFKQSVVHEVVSNVYGYLDIPKDVMTTLEALDNAVRELGRMVEAENGRSAKAVGKQLKELAVAAGQLKGLVKELSAPWELVNKVKSQLERFVQAAERAPDGLPDANGEQRGMVESVRGQLEGLIKTLSQSGGWEKRVRNFLALMEKQSNLSRETLFSFLMEYVKYNSKFFRQSAEYFPDANRLTPPPPLPPFNNVPAEMLSVEQRNCRDTIVERGESYIKPSDVPLLLVELFETNEEDFCEDVGKENEHVAPFLKKLDALSTPLLWQLYAMYKIVLMFVSYGITTVFGETDDVYTLFQNCVEEEACFVNNGFFDSSLEWMKEYGEGKIPFRYTGVIVKKIQNKLNAKEGDKVGIV
ncbi:hypothetical protein AGDE_16410 [Angomonas deanei]|uniref:Uncharacterized protein n=1 Tax=Angomonas deanei TaxID=59799 RepID=A0A7G2C4K4_9TRYP|nr:hypothetical protein AGDE_16410 [Angomonas deanei]CAD2213677.1 hypothetical protein, conserved [Angomonas deanei]|eukprot:EPY17125.1 hypothetical protein AGDE_16410 [Angomonas deanei]